MESTERSDILQRYEKDGYGIFRGILDKTLTDEAFNHVDWLLKKHPRLEPDELNFDLARDDPFWLRLVSDERLLDIAEIFVGSDIASLPPTTSASPPIRTPGTLASGRSIPAPGTHERRLPLGCPHRIQWSIPSHDIPM